MNNLLITPKEVIDLAFSQTDQLTSGAVKETKIIAAQEEYLSPVFNGLYSVMIEGKYSGFVEEYIKPALAYFVRYGMIPDMSIQVGNGGLYHNRQDYSSGSTDKQRDLLRTQALKDGNSLLKKALRYLECNRVLFPEYDPHCNIRKRVKYPGGIIM